MTHIKKSDKVLYLLNEPAMKEWIKNNNTNSESLDFLYRKHAHRNQCYKEISDYILETLENTENLCVAVYGHPTVLCKPAVLAGNEAKSKGHNVKIFPGISGEACLFADLMIDPGYTGLQSYEATDFLVYKRCYDPGSHLVLWQASSIGALGDTINHNNKNGIKHLVEYLLEKYPYNQQVIVYEAAQYPQLEAKIEILPLRALVKAKLSSLSTLYLPPNNTKQLDQSTSNALRGN